MSFVKLCDELNFKNLIGVLSDIKQKESSMPEQTPFKWCPEADLANPIWNLTVWLWTLYKRFINLIPVPLDISSSVATYTQICRAPLLSPQSNDDRQSQASQQVEQVLFATVLPLSSPGKTPRGKLILSIDQQGSFLVRKGACPNAPNSWRTAIL